MRSIVVLGPFRGGTSLVTGILQSLGVFVGESFLDAQTGYPTYEALVLREKCAKCFDEREAHWGYLGSQLERVTHLREWHQWAVNRPATNASFPVGGKHPTMCMLVDELAEAWKSDDDEPPLFLSVRRSVDDVIESWTRARTPDGRQWWPRNDVSTIVTQLVETRDRSLVDHEHLEVNFDNLRRCPEPVIREIASACGLGETKILQAASLVRS